MNPFLEADFSAPVPVRDETRDLTVIIAHRGPALGLWATLESCEIQLRDTDLRYDYVVVQNGEEENIESKGIRNHLEKSGKLLDWMYIPQAMSPPGARQLGSESADGKTYFFLDNHCVVGQHYFEQALKTFESTGADMVHSLTRFFIGEKDHLEYKLKLDTNFWAEARCVDKCELTGPYRIASGGHGGFAVRRDTWKRIGGYGDPWLFDGYGGEENYFDLKLWMHGGTNYLDPKMVHHHWSGIRPYARHFSDGYYRNMMICAFVIGGQKWVDKVYTHFEHSAKNGSTPIYELYEQAIKRSFAHAKELERTRLRNLDEQLEWFRQGAFPSSPPHAAGEFSA